MLFALLLALSAHASADLEIKTRGPVLIYIDGHKASLTSQMHQRLGGLDAGSHEVRVTGVFGKTLYEADVELPDDTVTVAEWTGHEMKILSTRWQEGEATTDTGYVEEEEEPETLDEVLAEAEPPASEPQPLAVPVAIAPPPVEETPLPATLQRPTSTSSGKTMTVQATPGMRVEVEHNGQVVVVVVEEGGFHIEDDSGLSISLTPGR